MTCYHYPVLASDCMRDQFKEISVMTFILVAVRDKTAEIFHPLFTLRTRVEAIRGFERYIRDPQLGGAPGEYDLVELGTFDDVSGSILVHDIPLVLANGAQFGAQAPVGREAAGNAPVA